MNNYYELRDDNVAILTSQYRASKLEEKYGKRKEIGRLHVKNTDFILYFYFTTEEEPFKLIKKVDGKETVFDSSEEYHDITTLMDHLLKHY